MSQPRIVAFAGSTRSGSWNKKLIHLAAAAAKSAGAAVITVDLRDLGLPLFDQDLEDAHGLPDGAKRLKSLLQESHGNLAAFFALAEERAP